MERIEKICCPACDNLNAAKYLFENCYQISCPKCGRFNIGNAFNIPDLTEEEKIKLRYWLYKLGENDNKRLQNPVDSYNKDKFFSQIISPSSLLDKIDLVLEYMYSKTNFLYETVKLETEINYPLFFCRNAGELVNILKYLKEKNYIDFGTSCESATNKNFYVGNLLPEGIKYIEESGKNPKSDQCFVAMWFNEATDNAWNKAISKAIEEAAYKPIKIDEVEHTDDINDRIISEIRRSKFLIVDLTGNRGGVYFEAGFGFGLGLPVIYTCRKDQLDDVHFDLKHRNMIFWEDEELDKFKDALITRIRAVILD